MDTSKKGTILIVDDEIDILQALQRQLRKKYDVCIAASAKQAYEILNKVKINVIISDQRMPDVAGTEFLSRVKQEYPNCIRIILTAYSDIESVINAINYGNVFRYITKPWDPEELNSILEQAFECYYSEQRKNDLKRLNIEIDISSEKKEVNILLVDDNADILMLIETLLAHNDYRIIKAQSATEALKYLPDYEFALILLDIRMPVMDGFQLAKILREKEKTANVPIIFLSAAYQDEYLLKGYSFKAIDYIMKPFDENILKSKINVMVELYRQKAQLKQLVKEREQEIEKRMAAECLLEQQKNDLIKSNVELELFAQAASHDLQEPLRIISIFLEKLSRKFVDKMDQEAKTFMNFIIAASNKMQIMIDGFLDYARVATAHENFTEINMSDLLEEAISNYRFTIQEKQAEIIFNNLPTVYGNKNQLQRVFENLIHNALKFCDIKPIINISGQSEESQWTFSVKDNGIGIKQEHLKTIFQIFKTLNDKKYQGSGIGLAITKRIIERHGGQIWAESDEHGNGTTIKFTIKRANT